MALVLCLAACGPGKTLPQEGIASGLAPVGLAPGEKLHVVATTTLVGDVVAQVGGEDIELRVLLPTGADLHLFEPTPQDLVAVSESHVVLLNGLGLEQAIEQTLIDAGGSAVVFPLSDGIQPLAFGEVEGGAQDPTGVGQGHPDPHVWLDPNNVMTWVENLVKVFSALDPGRADAYAARAQSYLSELMALDAWIREQVASIPEGNRVLVTDHQALGYFAARYRFELLGSIVPSYSTAAEPSARELAALEQAMRDRAVPAIFVSYAERSALADQVAADTGAKLVALYLGSLSAPTGPAPSYLALMEYNVRAITAALR